MVHFCPNDGSLLRLKSVKIESGVILAYTCSKCGYYEKYKSDRVLEEKGEDNTTDIKVIEEKDDVDPLPTTGVVCPKCGNKKANWWMIQTRSADEPPTQFFKCTKCGHTWRQYS